MGCFQVPQLDPERFKVRIENPPGKPSPMPQRAAFSMSMQDSLHPWMTNPSAPEGAFGYPASMMKSPWDKGLSLLTAQPIEVQFCLDARGLCHDI